MGRLTLALQHSGPMNTGHKGRPGELNADGSQASKQTPDLPYRATPAAWIKSISALFAGVTPCALAAGRVPEQKHVLWLLEGCFLQHAFIKRGIAR